MNGANSGSVDARPVMDGRRVKWTLEREQALGRHVRVDWLRFTMPVEAVIPQHDAAVFDPVALDLLDRRGRDLVRDARAVERWTVGTGALSAVQKAADFVAALLPGFQAGTVEEKGMDYYSCRAPLLFAGATVGFVLGGGRSSAQASTVHVNLFGSAMLHTGPEQWRKLADWIAAGCGRITRVDLALDLFGGFDPDEVRHAYLRGAFDVRGKRPGQAEHGSWTLGHSRTFEVGSRDTGKLFRFYEKGDEQFGPLENDPWVRAEVEFRSSHRVIAPEVLTAPAEFFAGAYPFCRDLLSHAQVECDARAIVTRRTDVADVCAEGAATRSVRWFMRTAAATFRALLVDGGEVLARIADDAPVLPKRLQGFTRAQVSAAIEKVAGGLAPPFAPSASGA